MQNTSLQCSIEDVSDRPAMRPTAYVSRASVISIIVLIPPLLIAQNPQLQTKNGLRVPTIVFTSVLWTADPPYYSIAVDSAGTATYQSASSSVERSGVPYTVEFAVSERTRRSTFNLAHALNFFNEDIPLTTGSPQETSVRTLSYHYGQTSYQLTYAGSSNTDIQELTSVFEELSETLEFGRRLHWFYEHDRTALAPELEKLQASADQHHLRELHALTTVLNNIVADGTLDLAIRQRAQSLLERARGHP